MDIGAFAWWFDYPSLLELLITEFELPYPSGERRPLRINLKIQPAQLVEHLKFLCAKGVEHLPIVCRMLEVQILPEAAHFFLRNKKET